MERYLAILEVSQKQAYIFGSNKVEDNVVNSAIIAKCLSPDYIEKVLGTDYSDDKNLVYAGGGHTILEFGNDEEARKSVAKLTTKIYQDFGGLSVFAKIHKYDEGLLPKENLKNLTAELEKKKAVRCAAFHHGSYGIERIDVNTNKPLCETRYEEKTKIRKEEYAEVIRDFTPDGFNPAYKFQDLGGEKNKSNFIAVVHVDGNGMGKRVDKLYDESKRDMSDWDTVKSVLRTFSESIDEDFKSAYKEMADEVAESIKNGKLKGKLNLKLTENEEGKKMPCFPIRRIITAGDDICFVTEGRIGLESAKIFIEKLSQKTNSMDKKEYSACAGVAIVHQKYPFYRAYELAEQLCAIAKKEGAVISPYDDGRNVCSIDWHIEYGELKDSIEDMRKDYIAQDGSELSLKPYIITAEREIYDQLNESKKYTYFCRSMERIQAADKEVGDGKIKQLRGVLKRGRDWAENYFAFYKLKDKLGLSADESIFDAIEIMDTFLRV